MSFTESFKQDCAVVREQGLFDLNVACQLGHSVLLSCNRLSDNLPIEKGYGCQEVDNCLEIKLISEACLLMSSS